MIVSEYVCFECGDTGNLHNHHVVPKILGGTKTVPLCEKCHGHVHGRHMVNHARLAAIGMEKARQRGVRFGRRPGTGETPEQFLEKHVEIVRCVTNKVSVRRIADRLNVSTATVQKVKRVLRNLEV